MKSIIAMFLPFFIFLFFTLVLFFYLKNNKTVIPRDNQVKEIFKKVSVDPNLSQQTAKKETRSYDYFKEDENYANEIVRDTPPKEEVQRVEQQRFSDALEVSRVRWSHHNGFERIVFDINGYNRGKFEIDKYRESDTVLSGKLYGYSNFTRYLPNFSTSKIVKSMEVYALPNEGFSFKIFLTHPIDYKTFKLKDPARLVIDMQDYKYRREY